MPWCETCSRFLNPNSLRPDGSCPACGRVVAEPDTTTKTKTMTETRPDGASTDGTSTDGAEHQKAPWHFKLLVLVTVIYLAWRAAQMIGWVIH